MVKRKNSFTKEFKITACELVRDTDASVSVVAANLGVAEVTLYRWLRLQETYGDEAFVGTGNQRSEKSKFAKMEREMDLLRQENAVLKKAAAYFTKQNANE